MAYFAHLKKSRSPAPPKAGEDYHKSEGYRDICKLFAESRAKQLREHFAERNAKQNGK